MQRAINNSVHAATIFQGTSAPQAMVKTESSKKK